MDSVWVRLNKTLSVRKEDFSGDAYCLFATEHACPSVCQSEPETTGKYIYLGQNICINFYFVFCLFLYFLYILKSSTSFVSDPSPCSKFPDQIKE